MHTLKTSLARVLLTCMLMQNVMIAEAATFVANEMPACAHGLLDEAMMPASIMDSTHHADKCAECQDMADENGTCCVDDCQSTCHLACQGTTILSGVLYTIDLSTDDPCTFRTSLFSSLHNLTLLRPPSTV